MILVGNKTLFPLIYQKYVLLAQSFELYHFVTISPNAEFYANYFIPEADPDEPNNHKELYVVMLRRDESYDKRIHATVDNTDKFTKQFVAFMAKYSRPYVMKNFNHRVRKYLIDTGHQVIALIYNKQTTQTSKAIRERFSNQTRDLRKDVIQKHKDNNFYEAYKDYFDHLIFMYLDHDETMEMRLGAFLGINIL